MSAFQITGCGAIGAEGVGASAVETSIRSGQVAPLATVDRSAGFHRRSSAEQAHLARHDLTQWLSPMVARRMSPPSRLAVAAAKLAVEQAGLEAPLGARTGVVLSTSFGASSFTEGILRQIVEEGPQAVSPFYFTESVANAPANISVRVVFHADALSDLVEPIMLVFMAVVVATMLFSIYYPLIQAYGQSTA